MDAFAVIVTVVVLIGIATSVLLFEKKRALRIERDLRGMSYQARHRRLSR